MTKTAMDVAKREIAFIILNECAGDLTGCVLGAEDAADTISNLEFTHNNKKYSLRLVEEDAELPDVLIDFATAEGIRENLNKVRAYEFVARMNQLKMLQAGFNVKVVE